jgi:hypothetical protein
MTASTRRPFFARAPREVLAALLLALLPALSCESDGGESTGGETHFLARCEPGSSLCGASLSCLCGVCTRPCDAEDACGALPGAACHASDSNECAEARCDVECTSDADCAIVSPSHRCDAGACRTGSAPSGAGGEGAQGGEVGQGGDGGASANTECPTGEITSDEVIVIGDSFFATTHRITAELEALARDQGALAADATYRDYSNLTANGLATDGIATQYSSALAEGPVGLVVMNGGGADALTAICETAESCPPLPAAADALEELLRTMATDGVREVVYAFYPDPVDEAVRSRVDVLRPLVQTACAESPLPCRWLDLRDTFAGRYAEYVTDDGLNPTDAGSRAAAELIWSAMRACVAP